MTSFSANETRAVSMLATLYVVRMLGLFMVLPLISIYSADMVGATPFLLGLAVGAYGLTQATLQIPMGWLSDHIDRRWVIVFGLSLLVAGSVVAALSTSIWGVIGGRFLQGAGAIASATMALVADYTRVEQRAKASAIIGGSIAIAFGLALVLGPTFANFGGLQAVFAATGVLALAGMGVVALLPKPQRFQRAHREEGAGFNRSRLSDVLSIKSLNTMYLSIFFLHFILMAVFVVVPSSLETQANISREHHAWVYLAALVLAVPGIYWLIQGRRYMNTPTRTLLTCLGVLLVGLISLAIGGPPATLFGLLLFFTGFTALEAMLPSLASIYAPADSRGTAMGVFASSQFSGVFFGGVLGGALLETSGVIGVWLGLSVLALGWVFLLSVSRLASPISFEAT
ncbi:MFS transporter [Luminiphilus sp.]|nr:MFS transporter [Luminiphilus sp.]MDA9837530.1 MFS transporter [Luminiphilus sp.]MDB2379867.1 MFS transporter [Luminiphilus sp.]MDB2585487.1 MFS transporter [Luminiphilus sp.]MDB2659440.1 MFS transporter [Luminiphilus sp.]